MPVLQGARAGLAVAAEAVARAGGTQNSRPSARGCSRKTEDSIPRLEYRTLANRHAVLASVSQLALEAIRDAASDGQLRLGVVVTNRFVGTVAKSVSCWMASTPVLQQPGLNGTEAWRHGGNLDALQSRRRCEWRSDAAYTRQCRCVHACMNAWPRAYEPPIAWRSDTPTDSSSFSGPLVFRASCAGRSYAAEYL